MLLILARISSEMRYVTAATKVFSSEIRVSACLWGVLIVLCHCFSFCGVSRLQCLFDNKHWFNTASHLVCDDLSTRRSVYFWDFWCQTRNELIISQQNNDPFLLQKLQFVERTPGQEERICSCDRQRHSMQSGLHIQPGLYIAAWIFYFAMFICSFKKGPDLQICLKQTVFSAVCSLLSVWFLFYGPVSHPHLFLYLALRQNMKCALAQSPLSLGLQACRVQSWGP